MRLAGPSVRNGVRQVAFTRRTPKNSLNKGTVTVDIRHHHHNVTWRQLRIVLQHRQQLIVKDFNLALRAVANVDRDAAIVAVQLALTVAAFKFFRRNAHDGAVFEIQNVELDIMQQAIRSDLDEGIHIPFA